MLLSATVFIVLEFLGNTILEAKEINSRSVNVDLETVFSFKGKEKHRNANLLNKFQDFISNVKQKVEGNDRNNVQITSERRYSSQDTTITDLLQELIHVLTNFKDEDLQDAFAIADDEIKKYHYKGCKFHELMSNQDIRKFVKKFELLKSLPAHVIRDRLDTVSALLNEKPLISIINYINSMYKKDDIEEFKDIVEYFKGYKSGVKNTNELIALVRDTVRRMLFDHYSSMNSNTRRALKAKLEALLWKDANKPQSVQNFEWKIEYTAPTTDVNALRQSTTTEKDLPRNINLNFQIDNQFESVEKTSNDNTNEHVTNKKDVKVPKKYANNKRTDKKKYFEDNSESKDHRIGMAVNRDTEHFSDVDSSDDDITTKKHHTKYKYTASFYMEQTSKEYKPYKTRGSTNGNIGRSYNKQNNVTHHQKHTIKTTTEINTDKSDKYKSKKYHKNRHSKSIGLESYKKKERYVPKIRDDNSPKGEKHKFSMHSYLKTVHYDGNELRLILSESGSDDDDKKILRMHKSMPPKIKNSQDKIVQKPQTTKTMYTTTQKKVPVTPLYEESSDDNSEEFTKGTNESILEKRYEPNTDDESSSEQDNRIQKSIPQTTKELYIRNDQKKSSEVSKDQSISNGINKLPQQLPKNKHIVQESPESKIYEGSTNSESKESSENDKSLRISKQPNKHDDISHEDKNSRDYSEKSKEHSKTTPKPIQEIAQKIKTDDSTTSSESEEEKSLNEETYMRHSINQQRGKTKRPENSGLIPQMTADLYTTKEPINVYEESHDAEDSDELSEESTENVRFVKLHKTYDTKSTNKSYPISFELIEETKTNNEVLKQGYIDNVMESGTYPVNDLTTKATEIKTKKEPVQKQISENASSIEIQLSTENESPAYYERVTDQEIKVKSTKPKESHEYSREEKDYLLQETKMAPPNEFETSMDQRFLQEWVKETVAEQALINQQLQTNVDMNRSRKQNKEINSPIPETLTTITKTNLFNYGTMTEENIKNKRMEIMRQRNEMLKEYNDPHMPLNLMQNYGVRPIDNKENNMIQQEMMNLEETNLQDEVIQTGKRDLRRNEYQHGSSSELFKNLSAMKKHLDEKYSTFNQNTFVFTELKESTNTQFKPSESNKYYDLLESNRLNHLTEKYTTTVGEQETQENKNNISKLDKEVPNFQETYHKIDNFKNISPGPKKPSKINKKHTETTAAHVRIEATLTTEPIESLINKMNISDILEKQSWILDHKAFETNTTEKDKVANTSFRRMLTNNVTENANTSTNTDLNKSTRSYIVLSDFVKSHPVKMDLDTMTNEIISLNKTQNKNQDFRRHKMGNRAKIKQLQQMYKTIYAMETTKPETITTTISKPTTTVTKIKPSTEPTTTAEVMVSSTYKNTKKEFSTTSKTPITRTKKKRRRKKRRRRTSTSPSTNSEPSTVTTESTISTTENTKYTKEYTSTIAKEISLIPRTKASTYKEIVITTTQSTVNTGNTKELSKTRSETVITTDSTNTDFETIPELTETLPIPTQPVIEPIISTEYTETTINTTEYRKSNTIDFKTDNAPIETNITEYLKSNTIDERVNTPKPSKDADFIQRQVEVDDYQQLLKASNDNNTYVSDIDYDAIPFKNETNRERIEMMEKFDLQPTEANETGFGLKDAIALADALKPEHNLETELRMEKSRLLLNKDMMKLYGHTVSAMTLPATVPSNTLYTDPFDTVMPGGIDIGLGFI